MSSNEQNEFGLPLPDNNERKSSDLLPRFFRTTANNKFLQATLDQLVQPGVAEKINGYFGRKNAKAFTPSDEYVGDVQKNRADYQFEPAAVIKDDLDNVNFYKDYNDYINQLNIFGSNTENHSRVNAQETYAWNPSIDWDKFVNFREYYWYPNGPSEVAVRGQSKEVVSTYTVTSVVDDDNVAYIFNDGFERNPTLELYRGQTYRFEIDTPGHPIAFAITRSFIPGTAIVVAGTEGVRGPALFDSKLYGNDYDLGDFIVLPDSGSVSFEDDENVSTIYPDGIIKLGAEGEEIANVYIEKGIIEFTIPLNAPDRLFYISKNSVDTSGLMKIADIEENTFLNVADEILGKKTYTSANGVEFTNGLKIYFQGDITPNLYEEGAWYIEGVGDKITLVKEENLTIPATYSENKSVPFDSEGFDKSPFNNASAYPGTRDYVLINRSSVDRNAWSRYNRWFHRDVIEKSLSYNNLPVNIDESARARRPIIEFEAGLKLFNYGTEAKKDVDLVDTFTEDVFTTIEGQLGYNVDGIDLAQGMRILFTADTDVLVNGKIYEVNFITIGNDRQISLIETEDSIPQENETVFVNQGLSFSGKSFFYNGSEWKTGQEKTSLNQAPLFDLCCPLGNFYGDQSVFDSSNFKGTKIFSYKTGDGVVDTELGFPLTYRNINNSGDIVFEFNLLTDQFLIQSEDQALTIETKNGNLRKYKNRTDFVYTNGWSSTPYVSKQRVLRQYTATRSLTNNFEIDVYKNAGDLNDLRVIVYVNNKLQKRLKDYEIDRINKKAFLRFTNNLQIDDVVLIKTDSATAKNENGMYEFPINLERNPLNQDIDEFTLGEVIDHVDSMIEEIQLDFDGVYPGNSNLRDLGDIDRFGKRFVRHSGPALLSLYHMTNQNYNVVKSIEYSSREYSRFKRIFLDTASILGYDGPVKQHVDKVLSEINKDKIKTQPFYFSDMIGLGSANRIEYRVLDSNNIYFPISEQFSLIDLSNKAISVYLNGNQIIHEKDYVFLDNEFIEVKHTLVENDLIEIYEYESTDGSYIPPTPSKLGLYPVYEPELTIDDTYSTGTINSVNFEKLDYVTTSETGKNFNFNISVGLNISNYDVTIINGGIGFESGDIITVNGELLNGKFPVNNCIITVDTVNFEGTITSVLVEGDAPALSPIGPYKIYGETGDNTRGWFYPVYLSKKAAQNYDTNNSADLILFKGLSKQFYIPRSGATVGGEDSVRYDEYPQGVAFIRGHDGSYIKTFKDYRDNLLLELEKRIFNNIKVKYDTDLFDINDFVGGKFRDTGFTREEINNSLLKDFISWLKLVDNDYTEHGFYNRNDQFTFNYSKMTSFVDGKLLPGYWRAIYKELYDTDRPHSNPWEILGFSIKPEWWEEVYGPAPYSSNNLILWEDIEEGRVREPGKLLQIRSKYARPGLKNYIPVDSQGNLRSPIASNYAKGFFFRDTPNNFVFGDEAPVETAWRKSSEYPFSIIKSWLLNQPSKVLGVGFDISRIKRNLAGQYVYTETLQHISTKDIVFPNSYQDNQRRITSGLVNYIYNLLASNILTTYEDYKNNIANLNCQLGIKIAGFTDKEKFKLLLDSRSPRENFIGGIFVPEENYQVFLNTSSPIDSPVYSGVIIEKQSNGFIIRGYNENDPFFNYYPAVITQKDFTVVIGGISEVSTQWKENKQYAKGQVVIFDSDFYRVTNDFTSSESFDTDNLALLNELPITGGRRIQIRKNFNKRLPNRLPYGTKLKSIQEVVDFLLGYESYLLDKGFKFDFFNNVTNRVENWNTAAREFVFWTTQGWASGTTIALSPSSYEVQFEKDYAVVDDIFDEFYGYNLLKADGFPIERKFSNIQRDQNNFGLSTKNTDEGIFNLVLPLVQKEHVVLLDNKTVFSDIIYQPNTGYRQERIKVLGYRSDSWNGGLNIPGFVYDDAKIVDWEQWKDFEVGSLVRYKEFFYVAKDRAAGSETFDFNKWLRLNEKPEAKLTTNFDYRISQFADFYDLDTDGFDISQQELAQHLIGYQKREYLANIINDDVSQYKFYQGFIQDKGTKNAIDKLFGKLSSAGEEAFEYNEEWAIQLGRYGSVDNIEQVEYIMKEDSFQESPQAIELVQTLPSENFDKIFRIRPFEVYDNPEDYNHKPFPTTNLKEYVLSGGYVHEDDVEYKTSGITTLNLADINQISFGDYIWVTNFKSNDWTVLQLDDSIAKVKTFSDSFTFNDIGDRIFTVQIDQWADNLLEVGDIVGISGAQLYNVYGMFEVTSVDFDRIEIAINPDIDINDFDNTDGRTYSLLKLRKVRASDLAEFNSIVENNLYKDQKVWVDNNGNGDWQVFENNGVYSLARDIPNPTDYDSTDHGYSDSMTVTDNNRTLFIGSPGLDNGIVYSFIRSKDTDSWTQVANIESPQGYYEIDGERFGSSISVSEDGKFLAVGVPNASSVKTRYKGVFNPNTTYNKNDIIKYRNSLWKAKREILPQTDSQQFSSFDSYYQIIKRSNEENLNLLFTGHPGIENNIVQNTGDILDNTKGHFLVKAPADMFLGSQAGDNIVLKYLTTTFLNEQVDLITDLTPTEPFAGSISALSSNFITGEHEIKAKVQNILTIDPYIAVPEPGDRVETDSGIATVVYVYFNADKALIYVNDVSGLFLPTDDLFRLDPLTNERQFLGIYNQDETLITDTEIGGYWLLESPSYISSTTFKDEGRGLVYVDLLNETEQENPERPFTYASIQDPVGDIGVYLSNNLRASFITQLSYIGDPAGADQISGTLAPQPSDLWVVRAPKYYTDIINQGDNIRFELFNYLDKTVDFTNTGLSYDIVNGQHNVYDIWDGYIDFEFTRFDFSGFPFEPQVGDILEDVQTPFDAEGGLALTTVTTSSAEVVYLQRDFNKVRVYVKNVQNRDGSIGNWTELNNIARIELRRRANEIIRDPGDVDRIVGEIEDFRNDVVLESSPIGKLIVIKHSEDFVPLDSWQDIDTINDEEYWFYNENFNEQGTSREANPPFGLSKDYDQVVGLSADLFGEPGEENEGAVVIYRRTPKNAYELQTVIVSEYASNDDGSRKSNRKFGSKIKLVKNRNTYTLVVSTEDDPVDSSSGLTNKLEIFKTGPDENETFIGDWDITKSFNRGDIVEYRSQYYEAKINVPVDNIEITNSIYWKNISWRTAKDKNFRGEWDNNESYAIGSIVVLNDNIYRANTNISSGVEFSLDSWSLITSPIDYLGYLPNLIKENYFDETIYDPAQDITRFAEDFVINKNGTVLVIKSNKESSDSTQSNKDILIYRLLGSKYILSQIIPAPNILDEFGASMAINPAGTIIAIGSPLNDVRTRNGGTVYIYRQQNNEFTLAQQIYSPRSELSEGFGSTLEFSKDNLIVTSRTGDMVLPTTFDADSDNETTFDSKFTEFKKTKIDTGNVYIYEQINDSLVFSESFRYDDADVSFGENLLSKENIVYVGIPNKLSYTGPFNDINVRGTVLEYRKKKNEFAWNTIRQLRQPVDVSKIRGAFLYNKRENQIITYLDYIDPIQGKIAGPADQEITFKTPFDPARYNADAANNNDEETIAWKEEHVGKLWWDVNSAKFTYPYQGTIQYQRDNWNELQPDSVVNVYEWVESDLLPSQWDSLSDTENGIRSGISGTSLYGDDRFSRKYIYDNISKSYNVKYYFWVVNKRTIPLIENRTLSAFDVAQLIARPREQGYRFISFLGNDRLVINNCNSLIYNDDIVLNIRYTTDNAQKEQNLHSQYQLITDGLETSLPHPDIERKWIDSLIGFDEQDRSVPATNLTVKQKYGIQNKPRQSMFINRTEALKQVIERINLVLKDNIIIDEYDIGNLQAKENAPTEMSREWDTSINSFAELQFVSTNKLEQAILEPIVNNGEIISVDIQNPGRGYKVPPTIDVRGNGNGAEFEITLNNLGQITGVEILSRGKNYDQSTTLNVRRFSVLINADETALGKWTIYSWNSDRQEWFRSSIQDYDVTVYWDYIDWYDTGYSEFTSIDFNINESYELTSLNDNIGNIVKINNVGSGGWLLLEKVSNEDSEDYTVNYKTVGRQKGTIRFKDTLYNFESNAVGYDNTTFDNKFYDNNPNKELRIILKTIKEDIFISSLKLQYNQLFFSSLRYILSEQLYVDWMFKTSFIKIKHNLGELEQDITFDNDTLPSYESYVKEVKPYKTVIREFVSAYESIEPTNTATTDFDTPPAYSNVDKKILPTKAKIIDDSVVGERDIDSQYPRKHWLDNIGYNIVDVRIDSGGSGYTFKPTVRLEGGGGSGATAEAYLGYGSITKIKITNPGLGYITSPKLIIEGPQTDDGVPASATAILGNGLVRSPTVKIKFDRTSGKYYINALEQQEIFTGTNIETEFDLSWPLDLRPSTVSITVNGEEKLRSEYTFENVIYEPNTNIIDKEFNYGSVTSAPGPGTQKITDGYTYEKGRIKFTIPPANGAEIVVNYMKPLSMLAAEDRINFGYDPSTGMFGRDLSQLIEGVDYGGVEIHAIGFGEEQGWDTSGWFTDNWDKFIDLDEDIIFNFDGSTIFLDLETPLQKDVAYNVYYRPVGTLIGRDIRLDDPNYGTEQQTNPNAIMNSIIGDGVTQIIDLDELGIKVFDGDTLTLRKITSDGSFNPAPDSYDTALSGGDLAYNSAKGVNAEEIKIDGDGFVTPTTSSGPEELIPGQVMDTLDIKVYTKDSNGQGLIFSQNYVMDATKNIYDLGNVPSSQFAVFVKVDNVILDESEYVIDWNNNTVEIKNPINNVELNIISIEGGAQNIVDYATVEIQEDITDYLTIVDYNENLTVHVTINGVTKDALILESEDSKKAIIRLQQPEEEGKILNYVFFDTNLQINFSQVNKETFTITEDTKISLELLKAPFYELPTAYNTLVKVNDKILNAGYNIQHIIPANRKREYGLEEFQQPGGSVESPNLKVFLNGQEITSPTQWRFEIVTSEIVLSQETGEPGDVVDIFVITDGEYTIENNTVTFTPQLAVNDTVEIYSFSNHDILQTERINYDVVDRKILIPEDLDYITYNRLTVGEISLRKPAADAKYLWVSVNGELLSPNVDFDISEDGTKLRLIKVPDQNDIIDVLHFTAPVTVRKIAFRKFKDILNRTHYKRLDKSITTLSQDLNYYDLRIEVLDGENLPEPNKGKNLPGIIFINDERIEYFVKEGNTLRQLRRGTLGTGVKNSHSAGSEVFDQNSNKTIPYQDTTSSLIVEAGGYNESSSIYENSDNIQFDKILYDFNNNVAFPLGGQLATVKGSGFRPVVELFVGGQNVDISIPVPQIVSDNKIKLSPPAHYQANSWNKTLQVGKIIKFTGSTFGGITPDTEYYITGVFDKSVFKELDTNEVYITVSKDGVEATLSPQSGEMSATYNTTTYVDENTVQFITSENLVGSYDLVILNPEEPLELPVPIQQTSFVAQGAVEYVQILLPFAPLPDERSEVGWYKKLTEISVSEIVPGRYYRVATLGNTDWNSVGSFGNENEDFLATNVGTGTGTVLEYSSIPYEYWEAKDIDLFANGVRLRKTPLTVFDPTKSLDSPDGDLQLEAEYAVNKNIGAYVRLTEPPVKGTQILITRKQGRLWTQPNETLGESQNNIGFFLRAGTSELPK